MNAAAAIRQVLQGWLEGAASSSSGEESANSTAHLALLRCPDRESQASALHTLLSALDLQTQWRARSEKSAQWHGTDNSSRTLHGRHSTPAGQTNVRLRALRCIDPGWPPWCHEACEDLPPRPTCTSSWLSSPFHYGDGDPLFETDNDPLVLWLQQGYHQGPLTGHALRIALERAHQQGRRLLVVVCLPKSPRDGASSGHRPWGDLQSYPVKHAFTLDAEPPGALALPGDELDRRLLGWCAVLGPRFSPELVTRYAIDCELDVEQVVERLQAMTVDALWISEWSGMLWMFPDKARHRAALDWLEETHPDDPPALREWLSHRLPGWIDKSFGEDGNVKFGRCTAHERMVGPAREPSAQDIDMDRHGVAVWPDEYRYEFLRCAAATLDLNSPTGTRALAMLCNDALRAACWPTVQFTLNKLLDVDWATLPESVLGLAAREDLRMAASEFGITGLEHKLATDIATRCMSSTSLDDSKRVLSYLRAAAAGRMAGHPSEAYDWLERAREIADRSEPLAWALRVAVCRRMGEECDARGRMGEALPHYARALHYLQQDQLYRLRAVTLNPAATLLEMADLHRRLGDSVAAERMLELAMRELDDAAVRKQDKDNYRLEYEDAQSAFLREQGREDEALPFMESALERVERRVARMEETASSMCDPNSTYLDDLSELAQRAAAAGRKELALAAAMRLEKLATESLPLVHPLRVHALRTMAETQLAANDSYEASRWSARALAQAETRFGPGHPRLFEHLLLRARCLKYELYRDEALAVLGRMESVLAADPNATDAQWARMLVLRGECQLESGQCEEAAQSFATAVERAQSFFGPAHLVVAEAMEHLGRAHLGRHARSVAASVLRTCRKIRQLSLGPDHPQVLETEIRLADAVQPHMEAVMLLQHVVAAREAVLPPHHAEIAAARVLFGIQLYAMRRWEEAHALLQRVSDEFSGTGYADWAIRFRADLYRARSLLALARKGEAEQLLIELLARPEGPYDVFREMVGAGLCLAEMRIDAGRVEEARDPLELAIERLHKRGSDLPNAKSEEHVLYIESRILRARVRGESGEWKEALESIHEAQTILAHRQVRSELLAGRLALQEAQAHAGSGDLANAMRAAMRAEAHFESDERLARAWLGRALDLREEIARRSGDTEELAAIEQRRMSELEGIASLWDKPEGWYQ